MAFALRDRVDTALLLLLLKRANLVLKAPYLKQ